MYLIIASTNRIGSNTKKLAKQIESLFIQQGVTPKFYSLESLTETTRGQQIEAFEKEALIDAHKIVLVVPEYNGTFPGILKLLIDNSDIKKAWWHKKVMLTGLSSGRAGNLRGLDHLTNALNYLKVHVLPNKLPISGIDALLDTSGNIAHEGTLETLKQQVIEFIAY